MPKIAIMSSEITTLRELAQDWYDSWNARDLERVLAHYADDVVFTSPMATALGAGTNGTVSGKAALREYWSAALERHAALHFEPLAELYGVNSVVLHYRGVGGALVAEVLELGPDGLITRALAHYDRLP